MIDEGTQSPYRTHEATTLMQTLQKLQDAYLAYLTEVLPGFIPRDLPLSPRAWLDVHPLGHLSTSWQECKANDIVNTYMAIESF
jgi:hypothetical protein